MGGRGSRGEGPPPAGMNIKASPWGGGVETAFVGGGGGQGGGSVGTPTYTPQNDPHDALTILNVHKWGEEKLKLLSPPIRRGKKQTKWAVGLGSPFSQTPSPLGANFWSPNFANVQNHFHRPSPPRLGPKNGCSISGVLGGGPCQKDTRRYACWPQRRLYNGLTCHSFPWTMACE